MPLESLLGLNVLAPSVEALVVRVLSHIGVVTERFSASIIR